MSPPRPNRRRGIALALGLLVLGVLVLIFAALIRRARQTHEVQVADARAVQSEWLAESALERARARLDADPDYSGETWLVPADALGGPDAGRVLILVEPIDGRPALRRASARAEYPDNRWTRVRRSKTAILAIDPDARPGKDERP
jgi:hypothetical protein